VSKRICFENVPFEIPASCEWVKLDDFVLAVTDGDHQPPPQSQQGVPFLVISDVNTGVINFESARYVSQSYYDSLPFIRKATCGDILFTVTGSYGIVIKVDTQRDFCFQRHIGLIKTILCTDWLYYALQ
jgi:type I restriction enzyme S subunit